jgi:SAM-dependent methyltransferase
MRTARFVHRSLLTVCFALIATCVFAQSQPASKEFIPSVGQAGKDVIWVPTAQALADKMLNLAKVTPQDYVIDLGSGDGRIVITAAKRGAEALGIEYNPDMVALSKRNAAREGVGDKAQFMKADLFETDFSKASVITMFLLPDINLRLRPKILDLKPGTRVVSNSFTMGDWTADQTVTVTVEEGCDNSFCEAYLWIVPAKVEGTWQLPQGELVIKQSYQMLSGSLRSGNDSTPITNGRLRGDQVSFSVGDAQYSGRVNGSAMEGTVTTAGRTRDWNAARIGRIAGYLPASAFIIGDFGLNLRHLAHR